MSAYTNLMGVVEAGKNEDAFSALAGQMSRAAVQLAAEWIRAAALAEWAI